MRKRSLAVTTFVAMLLIARAASGATVDGANIHWSSTGSGSKTLIFVHGWTCDDSSWRSQVPVVSKEYRVITLDLPGHGRCSVPDHHRCAAGR